jgi:hypothetical protein
MSLPEISRRCRSCGAAVRAGARFCPQCGQLMDVEDESAEGGTGVVVPSEATAPATLDSEAKHEWTPPTREFSAFVESLGEGTPRGEPGDAHAVGQQQHGATAPEPSDAAPLIPSNVSGAAEERVATEGATRGRVARVRDGTRARVGKMKDEALVVLEETPDDSGLRFVLAAAALFILFLLLLLLSTKILR